jgi:hypothetical protein
LECERNPIGRRPFTSWALASRRREIYWPVASRRVLLAHESSARRSNVVVARVYADTDSVGLPAAAAAFTRCNHRRVRIGRHRKPAIGLIIIDERHSPKGGGCELEHVRHPFHRINTVTMAVSQTAIGLLKIYLLLTRCQFFLVQPSARELLVNHAAQSTTPPERFPLSDAIVTRNQLLGLPEKASLEPIKEGLQNGSFNKLSESASAT